VDPGAPQAAKGMIDQAAAELTVATWTDPAIPKARPYARPGFSTALVATLVRHNGGRRNEVREVGSAELVSA